MVETVAAMAHGDRNPEESRLVPSLSYLCSILVVTRMAYGQNA